jgi:hypothetical protein
VTSKDRLTVVARIGEPVQCPCCGMWVESSPITKSRMVVCWCDHYLDIYYVSYVINELGVLR